MANARWGLQLENGVIAATNRSAVKSRVRTEHNSGIWITAVVVSAKGVKLTEHSA